MESAILQKLVQTEQNLDFLIKRKKLDLQESISKMNKVKKDLRIYVSNSASDQYVDVNQSSMNPNAIPSWTLKIEGKLMDNKRPNLKFSTFIKSIRVELLRDPMLYPQGNIIEWTKQPNQDFDGVEIKRVGDQDVQCKIIIHLDNQPEKFKLASDLANLLDIHTDSKANIIMALWQYVKANKLQDSNDKRIVNCDERLEKIFKMKQMLFPQIPDLLNYHLLPGDGVQIDYTIVVDKEQNMSRYAYDVQVELPDPARLKLQQFLTGNQNVMKEITEMDEKIQALKKQLHLSQQKYSFLSAFSNNPIGFIESWIKSQQSDMQTIIGDKKSVSDEALKEGIMWYLAKQQ